MTPSLPRECRELLSLQHGILARRQAAGSGLDVATIDAAVRRRRWQILYRGVYATYTGAPSRDSILWAALCRCGPGAVLSHFTAAELHGIGGIGGRPGGDVHIAGPRDRLGDAIHVSVSHDRRVRLADSEFTGGLPKIVLHRSTRVNMARHPARTPPRTRVEETVLDLTELAKSFDVAFSWLSTACNSRLITPGHFRDAIGRRGKLRWRADILAALDEISFGVNSNLELRYARDVERPHGLPRAQRQAKRVRGGRSAYLDNLYDKFDVAVELDGRAAHPDEARWQDIHRDNYFARSGIITLRYSWADVAGRPCQVAAEVGLVLRQRGWTGTLRSCGPSCRAVYS